MLEGILSAGIAQSFQPGGKTFLPRLSVYIVTLNEELRLPLTLSALDGVADEVIVVDAGSNDRTVEIARSSGAKIHHRDWDNYAAQKAFAESLCSGEWLMNIDADEEISPELGLEIRGAIIRNDRDAFVVRIADVYPGRSIPNRWTKHCKVIRLYRRGAARMGETYTHDRVGLVRPDVRVGTLKGLIHHRTFTNIHSIVQKFNSYSSQQVYAANQMGKRYSPWRMLFCISANFFRYFILHRQFLYGWWGYINSMNMAYLRFLKFAKFYEQTRLEETGTLGNHKGSLRS